VASLRAAGIEVITKPDWDLAATRSAIRASPATSS